MAEIYTQLVKAIVITGAGTDNTLQNSFKEGFVINSDTGRVTINGKEFAIGSSSSSSITNEQKVIFDSIVAEKISSENGEDFKFADKYNNVVARISEEGIRTVGVKVTSANGRVVGAFNQKTCGKIFKFPFTDIDRFGDNDSFLFTDKEGNVVARIDSQGVHAVAYYDANGNKIG